MMEQSKYLKRLNQLKAMTDRSVKKLLEKRLKAVQDGKVSISPPTPIKRRYLSIPKIGKRGKINLEANKKLRETYLSVYPHCEILRKNCWYIFQGFAHRHKRRWYYGKEKLLSSYWQTLMSCNQCHSEIEKDAKLTAEVFQKLRGNEDNT